MATAQTSIRQFVRPKPRNAALPVTYLLISAVVLLSFFPLLWVHAQQLWARPHYQFFPFVLLGAAVLVWLRFPGWGSLEAGKSLVSWSLLGLPWTMLAAAELLNSSWVGAVAFQSLVFAALYTLGGSRLTRQLFPAWAFLWLIVPLPFGLDRNLVLALQSLTTRWSSAILDIFGVYHVIAGNVVELGSQRFFVEEACAGINSLFSILACALFYIFFARIPFVRALMLIAASVFWILVSNICRVFLVAFLAQRWGINVAEGVRHDALGFLLFAAALGLIWSTDRLFQFLTPRRNKRSADVQEKTGAKEFGAETGDLASAVTTFEKTWLNSWGAAGAYGFLLAVHLCFYGLPQLQSAETHYVVPTLRDETLPKELDGWRFEKAEDATRNPGSAYGEFSKSWSYRGDASMAIFSLDYPFSIFHDLTICYKNQGWEMEERADLSSQGLGQPAHFFAARFKKVGLRSGYLFWCEFDQTGRVVDAHRAGLSVSLGRQKSALNRIANFLGEKPAAAQPEQVGALSQFQMFVETHHPLPEQEFFRTKERFLEAYKALHAQLFPAAEKGILN